MIDRMTIAALDRINGEVAAIVRDLDADVMPGNVAIRYVQAFVRLEQLAAAGKTLALARVDATEAWKREPNRRRSTADWLAREAGVPLRDAIRETECARALAENSAVEAAVRAGEISLRQAAEITKTTEEAPSAEEDLVELARRNTPFKKLRQRSQQARANAQDERERAARQETLRRVVRWWDDDGMHRLDAALTPLQSACFTPIFDYFAKLAFDRARREGRAEPAERYGADALVMMAEAAMGNMQGFYDLLAPRSATGDILETMNASAGGNTTPAGTGTGAAAATATATKPRRGPSPYNVHALLRVDATALKRGYTIDDEVCEVAGVGPIDVAAARKLLGDAVVDILVTDGIDVRTVAHAGRTANRTQKAALLLNWECEVRGCTEQAILEIDHTTGYRWTHWTEIDDLGPKCRCHHKLKSQGWTDGPRGEDGKRDLHPPDWTGPDPPDT
jgi:hypothetical protein